LDLSHLVKVARGDEPADVVLTNGRLVDVAAGEIYPAEIALAGPLVAGVGRAYRGRQVVDLGGRYVCPGFIDAHVHVESAMVPPREFARAVVPRGVTAAVTNPHEIANVMGVEGIRFMLADAREAPFDMFVTLPSCVPATRLETSGAELTVSDLLPLLDEPEVLGLGEVMDFRGVVSGDPRVLGELQAFRETPVDGHCPELTGRELSAYVATGITSEHECTGLEEAREKLRLGMTIFLREGSGARNLKTLLPLVTPLNERRLCLCTDDREARDLLDEGSIDHLVRTTIAAGVSPVIAIRMATLNPAEHFRLYDRGVVAPGRRADLIVFSDLRGPRPERVYHAGQLVALDGAQVPEAWPSAGTRVPENVRQTIRVDWSRVDFGIPAEGSRVRVIGVVPGELLTESLSVRPRIVAGMAVADPGRDILKMAVVERHRATGNVGLGFVKGMGFQRGAIAGTVAHDHHNLVVIGADDRSMATAAEAVAAAGGGLGVAIENEALALLPLPIAGLMSDQPVEQVRDDTRALLETARSLGSAFEDPFGVMSFLALEVIPSLKLTDLGLVDVEAARLVPLFLAE
jgi:adenine deaminase